MSVRLTELIIAAILLIAIRIKTGKPWPVILRDSNDWLSRYGMSAIFITVLVIFAIFFLINNGFFQ
jgi:hypothetical protein